MWPPPVILLPRAALRHRAMLQRCLKIVGCIVPSSYDIYELSCTQTSTLRLAILWWDARSTPLRTGQRSSSQAKTVPPNHTKSSGMCSWRCTESFATLIHTGIRVFAAPKLTGACNPPYPSYTPDAPTTSSYTPPHTLLLLFLHLLQT